MSSQIDRLSENTLANSIADLKTELDAFKCRQRTSGQSGILAYHTVNSTPWDYTGTVGTDADVLYLTTEFTAKFVGDGTQSPVLANLTFTVFVQMGSSSVLQLTVADNQYNDGSGRWAALQFDSLRETPLEYEQGFRLFTYKQVNYFIKASAVGSSRGSVTVTSP